MLQPVHPSTQFYNPGDFIAILCEGQFERAEEQAFPLATPVRVPVAGVEGVVTGHNVNDVNRIRVSWFNRTEWKVMHKFFDRGVIEVIESKTAPR
jgi:hypothetical protein